MNDPHALLNAGRLQWQRLVDFVERAMRRGKPALPSAAPRGGPARAVTTTAGRAVPADGDLTVVLSSRPANDETAHPGRGERTVRTVGAAS
ncbi:hypothetical protein, partial [Burkholderia gladioli]